MSASAEADIQHQYCAFMDVGQIGDHNCNPSIATALSLFFLQCSLQWQAEVSVWFVCIGLLFTDYTYRKVTKGRWIPVGCMKTASVCNSLIVTEVWPSYFCIPFANEQVQKQKQRVHKNTAKMHLIYVQNWFLYWFSLLRVGGGEKTATKQKLYVSIIFWVWQCSCTDLICFSCNIFQTHMLENKDGWLVCIRWEKLVEGESGQIQLKGKHEREQQERKFM